MPEQFKRQKSLLAKNIQDAVQNLDKVECSDLWLRKMKTLFNVFDFKKSGYLIKECCNDLAERFRRYADSTEDHKEYMANVLLDWWHEVTRGEETLPWERYYKVKWVIINDPALKEAEEEIANEFIKKMYQITDLDGNGTISLKEWRIFYLALGVNDEKAADEAFKMIDLNGDGVISLDEYMAGFQDYTCNQKESKYINIMGPLADV